MILDDKQTLFIHIPKTGGNTLQKNIFLPYSRDKLLTSGHRDGKNRFGLIRNTGNNSKNLEQAGKGYRKHMSIEEYRSYVNLKTFNVITVYRDPVDRLISLFFSPHRWYVPKKRAKILNRLNNIIGSGLDYTEQSYRRIKPSFDISEFESLVNDKKSFSEFMRGYTEVPNIILIRFDNLIGDMLAAAPLTGIPKEVIKNGLAEKLNVSEKLITTQQYSEAKNIVENSKHNQDYKLFDQIKTHFRQTWDN